MSGEWRARIFVASDTTITNYRKVIQLIKEQYNTYFADEECELILIGTFTDPLIVERLKADPTYVVVVVDTAGRRYVDGAKHEAAGERAINESINMGLIIHEGGLTEMLSAMVGKLAKYDVMTIVIGV